MLIRIMMVHLCDVCGKTFNLPKDLPRHTESIHGTIMLSCSKCEKKNNRNDKFEEHSRKCAISCKYCDRHFETKSDLDTYIMSRHPDQRYVCLWCGAKYNHKQDLKKHQQKCTGPVIIFYRNLSNVGLLF